MESQPKNYVGGEWISSTSSSVIDVCNPATGKEIAVTPTGTAADVDLAVTAARQSFETGNWRKLKPLERQQILWSVGDQIHMEAEEIAALETRNNGMPFEKALALVRFGAEFFRYNAGWCTKLTGLTSEVSAPGEYHAYTRREPLGVAGLITPWNVPFAFACAKISVALAAGCSAVFKPAEETPLTALLLGDIFTRVGIPAGAVNIVTGTGETVGTAIASHPGIDKVSFTGSTEVGKKIVIAAAGNLKKVTLELGGKSPVIVFADADISAAAAGAAMGIFNNSGQACVAGSRVLVARSRYDEFVAAMAAMARSMKTGDGFDRTSALGPLISQKQLDRVLNLIQSGVDDGAEIVTGGRQLTNAGFFVEPTLLTAPRPGARILREEIFGPVANIIPFDEEDEAIAMANDTNYGLAAGIWTRDIGRAHRCAESVKAGTVWLNTALVFDLNMPFGGYRQSGWGREYGAEGIQEYLQSKSVFASI